MKIAILHFAAPPVVGGVESVIGHHARLFADAGHQVRIIAGRGEQFDERVLFVRLPLADSRDPQVLALKRVLDAGQVPENFEELKRSIGAQLLEMAADWDWLIAHNVGSLHKNLALTAALADLLESHSTPRVILWHHDLAWTTPRYRSELHEGYPWDLIRTAWPRAVQVVVSAPRRLELAALMGIRPERIRVIPNGIDAMTFLKLEEKTQALVNDLHLLSAAPLLLLPVRITPRKNIEFALRVLAELRMQFDRCVLVVTGPLGPHNPANLKYFQGLTALRRELHLEGAAHFLAEQTQDYLPDAVIADFYRLADALFYPSTEEGFGIPILEAGLTALPVFCADIPPLRELGMGEVKFFNLDDPPQRVASLVGDTLQASPLHRLRTRIRREFLWEQIYSRQIAPLLEGERQ